LGTISPLVDQQAGGAIMWVPGNIVYLAIMSKLFFDWFNEKETASSEFAVRGSEIPVPLSNFEPRTPNSELPLG
ncbi:MAG: cytochrome c oxidase assembly protein, partial [Thermomicrobia bacterium]|nr:cytochrome c oxidase assembly protein [Thermomicrobia bacterium]